MTECDPKEVALKSFFLGPQAENADWVLALMNEGLSHWVAWRRRLFPGDGRAISAADLSTPEFLAGRASVEEALGELLDRFEKEVPKFSPRYLGHMFSEVSLPALFGHVVTLLHNPNNISGEASRVGVGLEDEAIGYLAEMVGYARGTSCGHFTSGGTIANFEAMTRARARCAQWLSASAVLRAAGMAQGGTPFEASHIGWTAFARLVAEARAAFPDPNELISWGLFGDDPSSMRRRIEALYACEFDGPVFLVPENKHYSWTKGAHLLGCGKSAMWPIELDQAGYLSLSHLERLLERAATAKRPVAMVVSVAGTTELGSIDPVHEVQGVLDTWRVERGVHIWHHIDAAFGGYFCAVAKGIDAKLLKSDTRLALNAISSATSVTLDPHKLGYVPYSSGAFLTSSSEDYYLGNEVDAPYLAFSAGRDKGRFTIEGSRSASGAVATWMTARTLGLEGSGYGLLVGRTLRIKQTFEEMMRRYGPPIRVAPGGDVNLLCFACAEEGESISRTNARTLGVYDAFSPEKDGPFTVSKTALRWGSYGAYLDEWTASWGAARDVDEVVIVRMCIMNPFIGSVQMDVNFMESFIKELEKILRKGVV